jgi:uncharacterized membrane protein
MTLFKILLIIHIIGGFTSLVLGSIILFLKKGTKTHKKLGLIYFYSMVSSALIAMPMCYLHPNFFLFIISVFTLYMLISGKRYLYKKRISDVNNLDWIIGLIMLLFGVAFLVYGAYILLHQQSFGIVLVVFGLLSILFVYQDFINFKGKSKIKNFWLTTHISRMMGSYIASVTAFIVVNNTVVPDVVAWLLPGAILTPLIVKWIRKFKVNKSIKS